MEVGHRQQHGLSILVELVAHAMLDPLIVVDDRLECTGGGVVLYFSVSCLLDYFFREDGLLHKRFECGIDKSCPYDDD